MADDRPPRARRAQPLNRDSLRALALHYVARYATSAARARGYLARKLTQRGWGDVEPPDVDAVIDYCVESGFIDDVAFAEMRAGGLQRRGYGHRRIRVALAGAGIARETVDALTPDAGTALAAAERFASRRRIGRFADALATPELKRKQFAAMLRAGHDFDIARRMVDEPPG